MFAASSGRSLHGLQGSAILEAQYHYQYVARDGRRVCISEGDRFVLLQKSNQDWWQVRREGEPKKVKPIYVPATYVVELPKVMAAGKRASLPGKFSHSRFEFSDAWPCSSPDEVLMYKRNTLAQGPEFRHRLSEGDLGRGGPSGRRASRVRPAEESLSPAAQPVREVCGQRGSASPLVAPEKPAGASRKGQRSCGKRGDAELIVLKASQRQRLGRE
ncbi:rho GTPase-activating protein 27-like isoform X2 [Heterodontus francisci]